MGAGALSLNKQVDVLLVCPTPSVVVFDILWFL